MSARVIITRVTSNELLPRIRLDQQPWWDTLKPWERTAEALCRVPTKYKKNRDLMWTHLVCELPRLYLVDDPFFDPDKFKLIIHSAGSS